MRINVFIAQASGLSRRAADKAVASGQVTVNGVQAQLGQDVTIADNVCLDGRVITPRVKPTTILFNKPVGVVCSRNGQGSKTIYDLLPLELHQLKPIGRLDKDSSGLLLLTNDGQFAHTLLHPRYQKKKIYHITLDKPLSKNDRLVIEKGVMLEDGISKLQLKSLDKKGLNWHVTMSEGRNRQIRRTFAAVNYVVQTLHRINFGNYKLGGLPPGEWLQTE